MSVNGPIALTPSLPPDEARNTGNKTTKNLPSSHRTRTLPPNENTVQNMNTPTESKIVQPNPNSTSFNDHVNPRIDPYLSV